MSNKYSSLINLNPQSIFKPEYTSDPTPFVLKHERGVISTKGDSN